MLTPSDQYKQHRRRLLDAEIALRDQQEQLAELRRRLPEGPELDDYALRRVADRAEVRLSELFDDKNELVLYHFMFGPDWDEGCPMCSMWLDGLNGVAHHIEQNAAFAVIAKAPPDKLERWAERRGWHRLRLFSSHDTAFNRDLGVETATGDQTPGISAFVRQPDGTIRLVCTTTAELEGYYRGMDSFVPVWHVLDLLPSGRGDWMPTNEAVAAAP